VNMRTQFEATLMRSLTDEEWQEIESVIGRHYSATGRDITYTLLNIFGQSGHAKFEELGRNLSEVLQSSQSTAVEVDGQ